MRLLLAISLAAAILAGGCGGGGRSAEDVVRAWSRALNTDDNEAAADLFAPGAKVIQNGVEIVLATHADAVRWNRGLPCSGRIVAIERSGNDVTATFVLGDRKSSPCDGPGDRAAAVFRIRAGRIVLWHQVPPPAAPGGVTI